MEQKRAFQTMQPSLLTYFHVFFTLAWLLRNTSLRGQHRVKRPVDGGRGCDDASLKIETSVAVPFVCSLEATHKVYKGRVSVGRIDWKGQRKMNQSGLQNIASSACPNLAVELLATLSPCTNRSLFPCVTSLLALRVMTPWISWPEKD